MTLRAHSAEPSARAKARPLPFATAPADGSYGFNMLPAMVFLGAGAGLCFPPLMGLAMSGASPG